MSSLEAGLLMLLLLPPFIHSNRSQRRHMDADGLLVFDVSAPFSVREIEAH